MQALRWEKFAVLNVGVPRSGETVVFLEDSETKDPSKIVLAWADPVKVIEPPKVPSGAMPENNTDGPGTFWSEAYAGGLEAPPPPEKKGFVGKVFGKIFKGAEKAVDSVAWWEKT